MSPRERKRHTPGEKHLFDCPLCGGGDKLDVARKTDGTGWWMKCWSTRCPSGGDYLRALAEVVEAPGGGALLGNPMHYLGQGLPIRVTGREPAALPSHAMLAGWCARLLAGGDGLDYVLEERGLSVSTLKKYKVGFDGQAITLPVFGRACQLANVRRRFLNPAKDGPKIVGLRGRGSQLYPRIPGEGPVLLVEGEFDALLARQHGIPAVTSTAGTSWKEEWDESVAGRRVAVLYDAGHRSWKLAMRRAMQLEASGARQAWCVDLRRGGLRKGEDLTDWFVKYGRPADELLKLIREARAA